MPETQDIVADLWRCDVTGNPVGTDTVMIGAPPCVCQGCRAKAEIERLKAYIGDPVDWKHVAGVRQAEIERLRSDLEKARVPEGWQVVPKEPTDNMADKGESSLVCGPLPEDDRNSPSMTWAHAKSCYRAMLSASPVPQNGEGEE